jgi:hypothetical protein
MPQAIKLVDPPVQIYHFDLMDASACATHRPEHAY